MYRKAKDKIIKQLKGNIVKHDDKTYLVAGKHQFNTIWFRDACFCFIALLECSPDIYSGFIPTMKNMVLAYLDYLNVEGYGPKCLDTQDTEFRVVKQCVKQVLEYDVFGVQASTTEFDPTTPFVPMYKDRREAVAIDTNLLVFLVAKCLHLENDPRLSRLLEWVETKKRSIDGLILQDPYSDWADSRDRSPVTFLTNLLYWKALQMNGQLDQASIHRVTMCRVFQRRRKDSLYQSMEKQRYVCLEDQLFAIHWRFMEDPDQHFRDLQHHPLWCNAYIPGFPTYPSYRTPSHWQARIGGLNNYHDSLYWSWLIAFSGVMSVRFGDVQMNKRIYDTLILQAFKRDGGIAEIYKLDGKDLHRFQTWDYLSEMPWSWGMGFTIWYLDVVCHKFV